MNVSLNTSALSVKASKEDKEVLRPFYVRYHKLKHVMKKAGICVLQLRQTVAPVCWMRQPQDDERKVNCKVGHRPGWVWHSSSDGHDILASQ